MKDGDIVKFLISAGVGFVGASLFPRRGGWAKSKSDSKNKAPAPYPSSRPTLPRILMNQNKWNCRGRIQEADGIQYCVHLPTDPAELNTAKVLIPSPHWRPPRPHKNLVPPDVVLDTRTPADRMKLV